MNNINASTLNNNNANNSKGKKSYFFSDPKMGASYAPDHILNPDVDQ